ncbi:ankyrin repeat domain-containing protein [Noviherbaspirillum galbum]|uniref:Ankyrin repeat domain-containing protein n=1 Tax=Noviherbaspirillum galbum TaxID=2709383 RepID=A0A6B3SUC6_9BURK|nr:ankyrin repeat domain-containing protein [Noviherbaspirillum galbum]NEX64403.1 ankyrin repeat domain-containing protein [Noviherbaspirillum galbum]
MKIFSTLAACCAGDAVRGVDPGNGPSRRDSRLEEGGQRGEFTGIVQLDAPVWMTGLLPAPTQYDLNAAASLGRLTLLRMHAMAIPSGRRREMLSDAMFAALDGKCAPAMSTLLELGADVHAMRNGRTVLVRLMDRVFDQSMPCISASELDMLDMLMWRAECEGKRNDPSAGMSPRASDARLLRELLNSVSSHTRFADVPDAALHLALTVYRDRVTPQVVRDLVTLGADPNRQAGQGRISPLAMAARANLARVADELLHQGANVNLEDADGNTAGHIAAARRNVDVLMVLGRHGADFMLPNRHGVTARGRLMAPSEASPERFRLAVMQFFDARVLCLGARPSSRFTHATDSSVSSLPGSVTSDNEGRRPPSAMATPRPASPASLG